MPSALASFTTKSKSRSFFEGGGAFMLVAIVEWIRAGLRGSCFRVASKYPECNPDAPAAVVRAHIVSWRRSSQTNRLTPHPGPLPLEGRGGAIGDPDESHVAFRERRPQVEPGITRGCEVSECEKD